MKAQYRKLSLVAACMFMLCLMAFFLSQEFSKNDLNNKTRIRPRTCNCPTDTFRDCMCPMEIRNCSACLRTPGNSNWFDQRFRSAVEPLLRPEESMSSDALTAWLGLKSKVEFANQKRQPIEKFHRPSLGHGGSSCLTCAVVGNSRILRGSGLGFRINQHDVVFRMNEAPVQGFETDVGNVTTIRIMYPNLASTQGTDAQLLLLPLNTSGMHWFVRALYNQDSIWKPKNPGFHITKFPDGQNKDKVFIISLSFIQYVQNSWLNSVQNDGKDCFPSVGFVALVYAMHTCDQEEEPLADTLSSGLWVTLCVQSLSSLEKVSLFGFGADRLLRWSHYWDDEYWFTTDMHDFTNERHFIFRLQCEGKIAVYN